MKDRTTDLVNPNRRDWGLVCVTPDCGVRILFTDHQILQRVLAGREVVGNCSPRELRTASQPLRILHHLRSPSRHPPTTTSSVPPSTMSTVRRSRDPGTGFQSKSIDLLSDSWFIVINSQNVTTFKLFSSTVKPETNTDYNILCIMLSWIILESYNSRYH